MAKVKKVKEDQSAIGFSIKAIEILNASINIPTHEIPLTTFNFNINIENKLSFNDDNLIFTIVNVEITSENKEHILGSLNVSCIFEIVNYHEVVKINGDKSFDMPNVLIDTLTSISISTTRGIMFSTFKGTFLHNAFLPIVDPSAFRKDNSQYTTK